MIVRHLLWHAAVAAAASVVLVAAGLPLASALPIGLMAGCVAMVVLGGHEHDHKPVVPDGDSSRAERK